MITNKKALSKMRYPKKAVCQKVLLATAWGDESENDNI